MSELALTEVVFLVEAAPEGGYTARCLNAPIVTEVETQDQIHEQVRDAARCHFDDHERPPVIRLRFVRDEIIAA